MFSFDFYQPDGVLQVQLPVANSMNMPDSIMQPVSEMPSYFLPSVAIGSTPHPNPPAR